MLGQFKRGKSLLLNALLDMKVLPVGVLPAAALATFVVHAAAPGLLLEFLDGKVEGRVLGDINELRAELAGW